MGAVTVALNPKALKLKIIRTKSNILLTTKPKLISSIFQCLLIICKIW